MGLLQYIMERDSVSEQEAKKWIKETRKTILSAESPEEQAEILEDLNLELEYQLELVL